MSKQSTLTDKEREEILKQIKKDGNGWTESKSAGRKHSESQEYDLTRGKSR